MGSEQPAGATLRETVRKRDDVLASVRESPAQKPTLVDRLDISRSTVDRAIDSLLDAGLVRRVDGSYSLTPQGRLMLEAHDEYVAATETFADAAPLLDSLPTDAEVPRSLFERGTIKIADPHAPESAITGAVEELQSSDRLLVFSPVVKSNYVRLVHQEMADRDLEAELILERSASSSLRSLAGVSGAVEGLLDADQFSLSQTEADLPLMLYLLLGGERDVVGITVHEDGGIVGSVTSDDPEAVAWGRETFTEVNSAAEQLPKSIIGL